MTNRSSQKAREITAQARQDLAVARAGGEQSDIALAASNLGLAFYRSHKYKSGSRSFHEAETIAKESNDFTLHVRVLGIKSVAQQIAEQYPAAFQTVQQIQLMAEKEGDLGVQSDSLATQGQILIDSGDEVGALIKFNEGLAIATETADQRRQMNILGALGNYCLTLASADQAQTYFERARELARELGDRNSEIGYLGNLGTLMEWNREYLQAEDVFGQILAHMHETDNKEAAIQALRHLTQISHKLKDDGQVVNYAQQGVLLAQEIDHEHASFFYDSLIPALYRRRDLDTAHRVTRKAIENAHAAKERDRELDLLLSLGESYLVTNMLEQALETYQDALAVAARQQRMVERAHLFGRIGIILAELDRTAEALSYHQQAIDMAQKHDVPELEGEQWAMMAMAHMENGDLDQARSSAEAALQLFEDTNLLNAAKARELLADIDSAANHQI